MKFVIIIQENINYKIKHERIKIEFQQNNKANKTSKKYKII